MQKTIYFIGVFLLFALIGCGGNKDNNDTTKSSDTAVVETTEDKKDDKKPQTDDKQEEAGKTAQDDKKTTSDSSVVGDVEYTVHTKNSGDRLKMGDFMTMHLQYTTMNDSVIFSSFGKENPLSFKLQPNLFKGVLNEGLSKMTAGDSATFVVPAAALYGDNMPRFVKQGDNIKYTLALKKVQSQKEYQEEQADKRKKQLEEDNKQIDAYVEEQKMELETGSSGLRYKLASKGEGDAISSRSKITANYTIKLLDGKVIEDTKGTAKDVPFNRQIRGVREALMMLKKDGEGQFIIPSTLAYGDRKRGDIPPNSVLLYDVKVENVEKTEAQKPAQGANK